MSEWKKVKLMDISLCIQPGPFGTQLHNADYTKEGVPVIMPKDMVDGKVMHEKLEHVSEDTANRISRHRVCVGDIMVARKGDVRKCIFIRECESGWITGSDCLKMQLDNSLCDSKYVYYQLRSPYIGAWLQQVSKGATMPSLNSSLLGNIEIMLPDLCTQHHIATILSRYDSLIENYQKQIKLLEEAAQRLYKEWFVDLRFPGHENTKMVDGLPEGWEKKKAIDFFEMSIGKTPPRAEKQWFTDGKEGVPWVSISDMKDVTYLLQTSEGLTKEACEKHNVRIVDEGTVLLSFKLTVGRVSIAGMNVCTNEAIAHFNKNGDDWREYTLLYLRNYNFDTLGNTSGISKAVNSTIVKNMSFLMPSEKVLDAFSNVAKPLFQKIKNLSFQIRLLTEARDRLLPRLMSGDIEI